MGVTEQTYWQPLVKVMRHRWCCCSDAEPTQPVGSQAITYFTSVVMPVICWYTGLQPPSFFINLVMLSFASPRFFHVKDS